MQKRIPAVVMRGGTSKGIFFHDNHLPRDTGMRDRVILTTFGSPDPYRRQIDGMGGAASTTSKAAMIEGTVAFQLKDTPVAGGSVVHLGHPGGIVDVEATVEMRSGKPHYVEATVGRTARRLMEGYVLVPEGCFR